MPAAMDAVCSSAMPVSKNLSGNFSAKPDSPVPSAMAAVSAVTRPFPSARRQSASPNSAEKVRPPPLTTPVWRSKGPTPWYLSGCSSAKGYPLPFFVSTCTSTGERMSRAQEMALSSAEISCPFTGPR